jgi:hypothetical protein
MLLDYYLTLYGATLEEKAYGQHFKGGPYEMNPLWQQAVANHRWINPRLLALVGCLTAIAVFSPSPFVLGAVAAVPYLACQYWRWLIRARRRSTAPA